MTNADEPQDRPGAPPGYVDLRVQLTAPIRAGLADPVEVDVSAWDGHVIEVFGLDHADARELIRLLAVHDARISGAPSHDPPWVSPGVTLVIAVLRPDDDTGLAALMVAQGQGIRAVAVASEPVVVGFLTSPFLVADVTDPAAIAEALFPLFPDGCGTLDRRQRCPCATERCPTCHAHTGPAPEGLAPPDGIQWAPASITRDWTCETCGNRGWMPRGTVAHARADRSCRLCCGTRWVVPAVCPTCDGAGQVFPWPATPAQPIEAGAAPPVVPLDDDGETDCPTCLGHGWLGEVAIRRGGPAWQALTERVRNGIVRSFADVTEGLRELGLAGMEAGRAIAEAVRALRALQVEGTAVLGYDHAAPDGGQVLLVGSRHPERARPLSLDAVQDLARRGLMTREQLAERITLDRASLVLETPPDVLRALERSMLVRSGSLPGDIPDGGRNRAERRAAARQAKARRGGDR